MNGTNNFGFGFNRPNFTTWAQSNTSCVNCGCARPHMRNARWFGPNVYPNHSQAPHGGPFYQSPFGHNQTAEFNEEGVVSFNEPSTLETSTDILIRFLLLDMQSSSGFTADPDAVRVAVKDALSEGTATLNVTHGEKEITLYIFKNNDVVTATLDSEQQSPNYLPPNKVVRLLAYYNELSIQLQAEAPFSNEDFVDELIDKYVKGE